MSKVIVERPRRSGYDGGGAHRGRQVDHDLMVSKEGMRAPHVRHWGGKELNENLAPLMRFLRSRVGQRWNDVYSEISQHLRATNAVQQHVRDHLNDFVATRTQYADGQIWVSGHDFRPLEESWRAFYVDPRDGILRENTSYRSWSTRQKEQQQAKKAEEAAVMHVASDGIEYRKVDGIWYEVTWDNVPPPIMIRRVDPKTGEVTETRHAISRTDAFTGRRHDTEGEAYRSGKKQANGTVLRKNGLRNG